MSPIPISSTALLLLAAACSHAQVEAPPFRSAELPPAMRFLDGSKLETREDWGDAHRRPIEPATLAALERCADGARFDRFQGVDLMFLEIEKLVVLL